MHLLDEGFGALLDSELRFIAHPDESFFGKKMEEIPHESGEYRQLAARIRENAALNAYSYNSFNGVDNVLFSRKLYNGWYIYIATPLEIYNQDVEVMRMVLTITGMAATIALSAILAFMHRAMLRSDEASRFKSSFLANMSHEIRTPMNAIIGMTEILLHSEISDRNRGYVKDINKSANSLLSIINDILDLSKVESGKLALLPVHYDFPALVDNVASMFKYVAQDKGIEFSYESEGELPSCLYGDDVKLRQALTNICGNAVKFTAKGAVCLKVIVSRPNNSIVFEIKDTGMGIRKEDIATLFDAFTQSRNEQNRSIAGTGLGLAISKIFIEMMGGSITVTSEYGQGSTFIVKIPLVEGDPAKAEHEDDRLKTQAFKAPEAKILVVDDNEYNLKVAQGILALFQIEAEAVLSGKEAIKAVQETAFDLVFMDHMMPEMDGIEAVAEIRALGGGYSDLTIIALTANAIKGAQEMFLERGFNGFVSKPVEIPILARALRDWLPPEKVVFLPRDEQNEQAEEKDKDKDDDGFWEALDAIEAIEAEIGLGRVNGLKRMYRNNLRIFTEKIAADAERMKGLMEAGDIGGFAIAVHGTKSTLASIGAMALSESARAMEMAAKDEDVSFCAERFPDFWQQLLFLHERLSALFPEEVVAKREAGDLAFLRENVEKAREAVGDFDSDAGIAALNDLRGYDFGAEINGLVEEALAALKKYEYDEVRDVLLALAQK
jgi:signal transduction histidine kinase/DNA-binding NarL/FixJ family response regulator/HPt (histidine-containing phosphotransfer) domain-containing protein